VPSLEITEGFAARGDTLSCDITIPWSDLNAGTISKPRPGQVVKLYVDDELFFAGLISNTTDSFVNPDVMRVRIECFDWTFRLDAHLVVKVKYPEQAAGERIKEILREFADEFTADLSYIETGLTVPEKGYDYVLVSSVFDELAEQTGYSWYVDFEKRIHFFAEEEAVSPLSTDYDNILNIDTNPECGNVEIQVDISNLHNVVIIKDFKQKSDLTYKHRFTADGEQSFFALPMEPWSELAEDMTVRVSTDGGATWTERILEIDPLDGRPETIEGIAGRAYVCLPGDVSVLTDEGFRPIRDIEVGQKVLSHRGRWNLVTGKSKRHYQGALIELGVHGHFETLKLTPEHRVFCVRRERCNSLDPRRREKRDRLFPKPTFELIEEVPAEEIEIGDYLFLPAIPREEAAQHRENAERSELGRLIGYFLAEGFLLKKNGKIEGVRWAFHNEEKSYINDLCAILQRNFSQLSTHIYDCSRSNAVMIDCRDKALVAFLLPFGDTAAEKRLPPEILSYPDKFLIEIFRAYYRGDGLKSFGGGRREDLEFSGKKFIFATVSPSLAEGMRLLLNQLGCAVRLYKERRTVIFPYRTYRDHELILGHVTGQHAKQLFALLGGLKTNRAWRLKRLQTTRAGTFAAVTKKERTDKVLLDVYNLETKPDHSFVTFLGAVKNCVFNWGVRFPTVDLPAAGDLVEVDYRYVIPERVFVYFDPDSIDEMARREGSDGHHEIMISLPDYRVSTIDPIKFYAEMVLMRNAWPILTGSFETFLRGWRSGQFFYLKSNVRDIYDVAHWVKTGRGEKVPVRVWVEQVRKKIVNLDEPEAIVRTSVDFSSRPFRR